MFQKQGYFRLVTAVVLAALLLTGLALFATSAAAQTDNSELTAADVDSLLYMREEEKLAHDVYITLYDLWGVSLFSNIASSEQTHTEAVLTLLNQYGLPDPTVGNGVGVFTNPELQALYNDLVSRGSQSLAEALLVGGLIEEVDIADLQAELNTTNIAAVQQVYQNLLGGSSNHLRAFATMYESVTGQTYAPQWLNEADVAAIISGGSGNAQGNGNGACGGGNGNRGNGNRIGSGNANGSNGQGNNVNQGMGFQNGRGNQNGGGNISCQNNLL